jgi:serine/threonine protein kinase
MFICLLMEYYRNGDCDQTLKRRNLKQKHFSEPELLDYMLQLATAVSYLHSKNLIHRDLKPAQVIFYTINIYTGMCLLEMT